MTMAMKCSEQFSSESWIEKKKKNCKWYCGDSKEMLNKDCKLDKMVVSVVNVLSKIMLWRCSKISSREIYADNLGAKGYIEQLFLCDKPLIQQQLFCSSLFYLSWAQLRTSCHLCGPLMCVCVWWRTCQLSGSASGDRLGFGWGD